MLAAIPLAAQSGGGAPPQPVPSQPVPPGPVVTVPGLGYPVYVLPVLPKDDRTPAQRCWDAETARVGRPVSELDRRTIDLKCSQR